MPLDPRDPRILEALADVCRSMQEDAAESRWWEGSHTDEFTRRALARIAELGDLPGSIDLAGPAVTGILLTRLATALERIADALERE